MAVDLLRDNFNAVALIRRVYPKIRNVRIQNNTAALVAFTNTLSDDNFDKTVPTSVPSKLNPEGNIKWHKRIFISQIIRKFG